MTYFTSQASRITILRQDPVTSATTVHRISYPSRLTVEFFRLHHRRPHRTRSQRWRSVGTSFLREIGRAHV